LGGDSFFCVRGVIEWPNRKKEEGNPGFSTMGAALVSGATERGVSGGGVYWSGSKKNGAVGK